MGGGGTQTLHDTSHTETSPWAPAVPALNQTLTDATTLYNAGAGTGIYGGPRVAQLGSDSLAGLQSLRDQVGSDNSGGIATSALQGVIGSGGMNAYTQQGIASLLGIAPTAGVGSVLPAAGLDKNGMTSGLLGALGQVNGVQGASTGDLNNLAQYIQSGSNPVNTTANSFMDGSRDLTTIPQLQDLYNRSQRTSAAETNLSGVARGDYLDPTTNPYLQAAVSAANQNVSNAQKEAFASSGRYGSGNFAAGIAKAVNDTDTQLYANQYNQERNNQLSANSQIDAARQAAGALGTNITGAITGVQNTNNQNRLAGAGLAQAQQGQAAGVLGQVLSGNQFNSNLDFNKASTALGAYGQGAARNLTGATTDAGNTLNTQQFNTNLSLAQAQGEIGAGQSAQSALMSAAGALPGVDASRYVPGQTLLGVGSVLQGQDQANIGAAQQVFNEQNGMPWANLDNYASLVGGIGGMGGTTDGRSTHEVQVPSLGQTLLGGAMGIGGMAANLGKAGLLGSAGGAGGAGATGLMSLLGLSDARAKENIEPVGTLHDGQTVYRYNYKGDPRTQIGLIAQEVAQHVPEAVGEMPGMGGLMGVDYELATERAAALARKAG